jgi:hypothetical protein
MKNKIIYSLDCSGVRKKEVAGCFVMLVAIYTSIRYQIQEDRRLNTDTCLNLKFHISVLLYRVCSPISDMLLCRMFCKPAVF